MCNLFSEQKPNSTHLLQAHQTRQFNILQNYAWASAVIVHYCFKISVNFTVTPTKFAKLLGMPDTLFLLYIYEIQHYR